MVCGSRSRDAGLGMGFGDWVSEIAQFRLIRADSLPICLSIVSSWR